MGAGTPGSTPHLPRVAAEGDAACNPRWVARGNDEPRTGLGTARFFTFPSRAGIMAREYLSYRPDGVVFVFASVGKESSP
jgi:hypothetical protein